jgi:hypothetical protein
MAVLRDVDYVLAKLHWMRENGIWPNGLRYLWTDAFGVVLLVSLHEELGDDRFIDEAQWLVAEVDRVLGRPGGIRNLPSVKFAFTNYGVSVGLQAANAMPERVELLNSFFARYRSGDE